MYISVKGFAQKVLSAVKQEAARIGIDQGAVAICFSPKAGVASNWLGLPGDVTITEPLAWGGNDTIYRKGDKEVGDCAGVVAMKIAAAKRTKMLADKNHFAPNEREELTSGALPEEYVGNGRINWKGAIAFPIGFLTGCPCFSSGAEAMIIYVAVSGGTQDQDEQAAWAALPVIREILDFEHDNGWILPRFLRESNDPGRDEESDIAEPVRRPYADGSDES